MFENRRFAVIDNFGNRAKFVDAQNIRDAAVHVAGCPLDRQPKTHSALADFYAAEVSPEQEAAIEAMAHSEDQLEHIETLSPSIYRKS